MKKLVLIALAFMALQVTAQEHKRGHKKEHRKEHAKMLKDLSAEEMATLKTKKMTLHLDLTESQQKEIYEMNLASAKERKVKMEARKKMKEGNEDRKTLSKDEKYKMMNDHLDQKIAQKKQLKSILTKEQYEKFEKSMKHRKMKQRKKVRKRAEKRRS